MEKYYRFLWVIAFAVQVSATAFYFNNGIDHGLYNSDSFSYNAQWSKVSQTLNPFKDPILVDPDHDLMRVVFSFPHFMMGVTNRFFNPVTTYLIWSCIGTLTTYWSLVIFASALGFKKSHAHVAALLHYTFFHVLSQLPPLSLNQLKFIVDSLTLFPENIREFGPRQYAHTIFLYPLLYTLMGLTLFGIKKVTKAEPISRWHCILWAVLCLLMPWNYFFQWFQFAFVAVAMVGIVIWQTGWKEVSRNYAFVLYTIGFVLIGWMMSLLLQNSQFTDVEGHRFSLMTGLTEARFLFLPAGVLVRIVLWSAAALFILRRDLNSIFLVTFLVGCILFMNMQLVVGKNIQPGHWSFGVDRIFAWMLILMIVSLVKKYASQWKPKLINATMIVSLVYFVAQTVVSWNYFERMSRWNKERAEVIEFLKTKPSGVVLVPELFLETDILINTDHYAFVARGAQSAVSTEEQHQRMSHAAFILGYSKPGFLKWVHTHSLRFYHMLYSTKKDFSSSYMYDPTKQRGLKDFAKGDLPTWDWEMINQYMESDKMLSKKLDMIVLHKEEALPAVHGDLIFENAGFVVFLAAPLNEKKWGNNVPCPAKEYPL